MHWLIGWCIFVLSQIRARVTGVVILWASNDDVRRASRTILCWNTGFTFTSEKQKMSVVCISRSSSVEEFMNTLSHELDHVQEAVCKYYGIELGTEHAAYVQGDIMARLVHAVRVNK